MSARKSFAPKFAVPVAPPFAGKIKRFVFNAQPHVAVAARPGCHALAALAKTFAAASAVKPPAAVLTFDIDSTGSSVYAEAAFRFASAPDADAVAAEFDRLFAPDFKPQPQPKFDTSERFPLSFRGGTAPTFAAAFGLLAAFGLVPFTAHGRPEPGGGFFSQFELHAFDFKVNPLPFLFRGLTALGFTDIEFGQFHNCSPVPFRFDHE